MRLFNCVSSPVRGDLGFIAKSESCVKKLLSDNNLAAFYSVSCIGEDADVELPVQIRRLRETESPRVLRRLNTLRGLSHEEDEQVLA